MLADLPILVALVAVAWCAWSRPWVGVLGLVFVGVMHPHGYAKGALHHAPVFLAMGSVVALGAARQFFALRRLPQLFWDWRFAVAALLAAQMVATTWLGIVPWIGWPQLGGIARKLPLVLLVLLLVDDREKLGYLLLTIGLSIGVVVLKGGFWAVATGFEQRVYGPPGSEYADNNAFAVAVAMAIPLLALWLRQAQDRAVRWAAGGLIGLCFAAALSSWSRGGFLCLAVVALALVLHSRHKWRALAMLLAAVGLMALALPGEWFARMQTLFAAGNEGTGGARLELWRLGWDFALRNPWFGGGLGGWVYLSLPAVEPPQVWHSAYVTMAAEHGFIGLALWCVLLFGTLASLSLTLRQSRRQGAAGFADHAAMLRAALAAYAVGAISLSIAYWELLALLLAASIIVTRLARAGNARAADAG